MPAIEICGVDPSTYGFTATNPPELLSTPRLSFEPIRMSERPGAKVGHKRVSTKPFAIEGMLESTSLATAQSRLDNLFSLAGRSMESTDTTIVGAFYPERRTQLVFAWSTSRALRTEFLGGNVENLGPAFGVFKYRVTLLYDAPDPPYWIPLAANSVTSTAGSTGQLAMGNAETHALLVAITGPSTNATITLRNSTGGSTGTMGFTRVLTSTERLLVNMLRETVQFANNTTALTGTNASTALTSGFFFHVKKEMFNFPTSSWATIEVANGGYVTSWVRQFM